MGGVPGAPFLDESEDIRISESPKGDGTSLTIERWAPEGGGLVFYDYRVLDPNSAQVSDLFEKASPQGGQH